MPVWRQEGTHGNASAVLATSSARHQCHWKSVKQSQRKDSITGRAPLPPLYGRLLAAANTVREAAITGRAPLPPLYGRLPAAVTTVREAAITAERCCHHCTGGCQPLLPLYGRLPAAATTVREEAATTVREAATAITIRGTTRQPSITCMCMWHTLACNLKPKNIFTLLVFCTCGSLIKINIGKHVATDSPSNALLMDPYLYSSITLDYSSMERKNSLNFVIYLKSSWFLKLIYLN